MWLPHCSSASESAACRLPQPEINPRIDARLRVVDHTAVDRGPVTVHILIVDDQAAFRRAAARVLARLPDFELIGESDSGEASVEAARQLQPDLVLMDADMPGMSGLRAALLLSQVAPLTKVILMSMDISGQFRAACAGCGAGCEPGRDAPGCDPKPCCCGGWKPCGGG